MILSLDFDGVLITTPPWRKTELMSDGFLMFNSDAVLNLNKILTSKAFSIVLTTTHRINFPPDRWMGLLAARGIHTSSVCKVNDVSAIAEMRSRRSEIEDWLNKNGSPSEFLILDDDPSLYESSHYIKSRWVATQPLLGLNDEATKAAFEIISSFTKPL
ncbi:hypothetical protein KHS38_21060 [Mucilaginibacter sp. Bleaf8]|uniref:HAD domain-containing protein n=1 Tax=Mucilaginibacter sp. Bleaf8 TaxID=2834430 RepID=UPI001BD11586|nr:HAD domain-containing protein [Mucilaginibacter sp. Bleaf8]MBS7566908.1 hypothetical protein [Mucilaginibacter sp. Bleaf8]